MSPVIVVPLAGAVTVVGVPAVDPIYGVTVYMVIVDPFEAGVVQARVAVAFPLVALTAPGGSGTVAGVTTFEVPTGLDPALLLAVTVNEYDVPFVNPLMTTLVTPPLTVTAEPMDGVTV